MAAEEENQKHVIYGSAGMAAAGMIPGSKPVSRKPGSAPDEAASDEAASDEAASGDVPPENEEENPPAPEPQAPPPLPAEFSGKRAAVIGHTGEGGFGSGLSTVFQRLNGVRLVALVDENADTLDDSVSHAIAPAGFDDYSEMLGQEKPDLVCVAPDWTNRRFEMIKAALDADAHVLSASPIARTLKESDEILALASEKSLQIGVAGMLRNDPLIARFHSDHQSLLGELLEMNLFGDMGDYSGGEDLLTAGLPLLDLARWFGGDPGFVSATITKDGMPVIAEDSHESESRNLGLLLGDSIHATFQLESGIRVTCVSDRKMESVTGPAGIEFIGSQGRMRLFTGPSPVFSQLQESSPGDPDRTDQWKLWSPDDIPADSEDDFPPGIDSTHRRDVLDWLKAIDHESSPSCSGENAAKALEMAHGIWQSGITLKRAYFPLTNRLHPLSEETR